jgi:hypothetical protein
VAGVWVFDTRCPGQQSQKEARMIVPYNRVIVTKRIPEENHFPGDAGTVG